MRPATRLALIALAIAAGYFVCVMVSMTLRFSPGGWAIVWPMRAFLLAALLLLPLRQWWLIVAVVPVHALVALVLLPGAPAVAVATQLIGHLAVSLASALAIRLVVPAGRPFESAASLFRFILVAGIAVPAVVNLVTIAAHIASGWFVDVGQSWWQWMGAGFFITITLPPLMVLLAQGGFTGRPQHRGRCSSKWLSSLWRCLRRAT